ncbi:hypothetical protein NEUTE1DRAFT_113453 [Neurospora tetrasperma FGSC 2508]|uniref:Uncharacterized protein n=1 Tax=Neurospora tetrasperma (strain FGSC 2508 / ATCC MYA-4615 / P0657) TaxID=510951 RepID=F8MYH5_NEUT8|nr:uncharacterized protein NEUTE1DRAFT_113453 [Neurospora tetrasperma FGSC 2508]EGO51372.1 hypothetical protein NEUTE1DRAFT_113453 [Neurospora tetrasperma FGSC 2508]EGZ78659.1 hypothetical protein NEUTE2DRAFT_48366 [Neurospora tetrasperma FGSC 2509]
MFSLYCSVVRSLQTSTPSANMTAHISTPSMSQNRIQAGYRKPTVEDFDEKEEEVRVESRTDVAASDEYDLSEEEDYFASKFDLSTRGSDTSGQDSEQDEPKEEEKNRKDEKRRIMKEQAEQFLRAAPAGISRRVRGLMEKLARGEEVEDSEEEEDSEDEESDDEESDVGMDKWEAKAKMAKEVNRRHDEELIKYWLAKLTKKDPVYSEEEVEIRDRIRIKRGETRREAKLIMCR